MQLGIGTVSIDERNEKRGLDLGIASDEHGIVAVNTSTREGWETRGNYRSQIEIVDVKRKGMAVVGLDWIGM